MIEAAVSAPRDRRHTSPDWTWTRRFEDVDGVVALHEESNASLLGGNTAFSVSR